MGSNNEPTGMISKEDVILEVENKTKEQDLGTNSDTLFFCKSANTWIEEAKKRPVPRMLFGEFWYEGELCFLFADTNLGKSILAVQIGDSISKGDSVEGFKFTGQKQGILYLDFELSDKQFESRYSDEFKDHYSFDDSFIRAEFNAEYEYQANSGKDDFTETICSHIEKAIMQTEVKIVFIDNITFLSHQTEQANVALPLMKKLKVLKNKHNLSILVIAHTPKRDLGSPITQNHLAGSKMLINYADSAFAIGASINGTDIKYLKQIKVRNSELLYGTNNVVVCRAKKESNFLAFEPIGFDQESNHLKINKKELQEDRIQVAVQLSSQGWSNTDIGKHLGVSEAAVRKWLKKKEVSKSD